MTGSTAYLTAEAYAGRLVVIDNGYKYYVVSKHKTQFNASRQLRRLDSLAKVRKIGKWWMILHALPRQFQNGRLL